MVEFPNFRYFSPRNFREFPVSGEATPKKMIEDRRILSPSYLRLYLAYRMTCLLEPIYEVLGLEAAPEDGILEISEERRREVKQVFESIVGPFTLCQNWTRELEIVESVDSIGEEEGDWVESKKVFHYKGIARAFEPNETVFLSGKLEGTDQHFLAVKYLSGHAKVILAVEPESYYRWSYSADSTLRGEPFLETAVRLSLWAHHPLAARVTVVPRAEHWSPEVADIFYAGLFVKTGATYSAAFPKDPNLPEKLERGKKPEGKDWRVIPEFEGQSTSELLRLPDFFSRLGILI